MSIMNQNRSHFQAKLGSSLITHGQGKTAAVEAEDEFRFNLDAIRARVAITENEYSITLREIEYALDHKLVWVDVGRGRYWVCRRNGKTQRWVRDPDKFMIPIKFGFKGYGNITDFNSIGFEANKSLAFVISETDPSTK